MGAKTTVSREDEVKNNREQGDDEMEFRCYLGSTEK